VFEWGCEYWGDSQGQAQAANTPHVRQLTTSREPMPSWGQASA
jgi:hypothetical protein